MDMTLGSTTTDNPDEGIVQVTLMYREEANEAKKNRMDMNKINFDCYHLKQDYSHKQEGQSKEFLGKQSLAVEQITAFIQQGLMDVGDWFGFEYEAGVKSPKITSNEVKLLTSRQLEKLCFHDSMGDTLKLGLLGSLMIVKVHGEYVNKPRYIVEEELQNDKIKKNLIKENRKVWQLKHSLIRHQDYYPDPTGRGLYELQNIELDLSDVLALAEGDHPIYDKSMVELLVGSMVKELQETEKARETNQNRTQANFRKRVKLTEGWGTILDPHSGKILYENVTWTVANDRFLIQKPTPNPFWHQMSPFLAKGIVRTPHAVWPKALMDAGTRHNIALNELYNLIFDAGMMATHGIKQIRPDWLENEAQIASGIRPGMTVEANSSCPPGMKVLERVDTASMSPESITVFNLSNAEFQQSVLTNDLRLGVLPSRAVKATEVVEASQTITSVFTGVAKAIEVGFLEKLLDLSWLTIAQHLDDLDSEEVKALLGDDRAILLASMSPEERFQIAVQGHKFKVYGVSKTLNKVKDFRKLTSLLQTLAGSEVLIEEFIKKYDFGKMLEEIMKSLDINTDRLRIDEVDMAMMVLRNANPGAQSQPGSSPNLQSQIPQAATGSLNETLQSRIPQANFPPQALAERKG
jgi:hypothetical protein